MIAVVLWSVLGLVIGAMTVSWLQEARERRRVARLVRLLDPYCAVGTAAPSDIVVGQPVGWRHV